MFESRVNEMSNMFVKMSKVCISSIEQRYFRCQEIPWFIFTHAFVLVKGSRFDPQRAGVVNKQFIHAGTVEPLACAADGSIFITLQRTRY